MVEVTMMKCAHTNCTCIVSLSDAVMKDGKAYCSEACSNGQGCDHPGCGCH